MRNPIFNVGDVVNLKGDKNLKLTVNELKTATMVGNDLDATFSVFSECSWFACTFDLKTDDFKEEILDLAK